MILGDLEKFKHPRYSVSDRLLIEDILESEIKSLERIYDTHPHAGCVKFKIVPGFYLEINFSTSKLYMSISQYNPESYSSTLLGDLIIQFNENGIIPPEYNLTDELICNHVEDNIDEVAYTVICKNSAVYNIFNEIYYIIEARHCMNTILFKGETNEQ